MKYPLEKKLTDIDDANLHKMGLVPKTIVRLYWFLKNGFYSSSNWKWSRILCLFNSHAWGSTYGTEVINETNLKITIFCNRCHYKHEFTMLHNDLKYKLLKWKDIEV